MPLMMQLTFIYFGLEMTYVTHVLLHVNMFVPQD